MNWAKLQDTKSIHRNHLHFYIPTMKNQKEKSIPFTIATERIKYLGINLPKETKELYTENCDTNERNQRQHKQMERYSCSWIGRINIVKMTILPKAIYRFSAIPIKLLMAFFYRTTTKYFTIHMETQKTPNSQSSLEKEEWSWQNQPSWPQVIIQSYSHQDSMGEYWHKNRNIYQWNKIGSPETNPCTYGYLIFDKGDKNIQWGKNSLFNKWC